MPTLTFFSSSLLCRATHSAHLGIWVHSSCSTTCRSRDTQSDPTHRKSRMNRCSFLLLLLLSRRSAKISCYSYKHGFVMVKTILEYHSTSHKSSGKKQKIRKNFKISPAVDCTFSRLDVDCCYRRPVPTWFRESFSHKVPGLSRSQIKHPVRRAASSMNLP